MRKYHIIIKEELEKIRIKNKKITYKIKLTKYRNENIKQKK